LDEPAAPSRQQPAGRLASPFGVDIAERVASSRVAQGFPRGVEDAAALSQVAGLLARVDGDNQARAVRSGQARHTGSPNRDGSKRL
jgi:hypothetical protein